MLGGLCHRWNCSRQEFDPLGNDAPLEDPAPPEAATPDYLYPGAYDSSGNPYDAASGCTLDGQPVACSVMLRALTFGTGVGLDGGSVRVTSYNGRDSREFPPSVIAIQIPGNRVARQPQRTEADQKCDDRLAEIFGGKGSIASTGFDPPTLRNGRYKNGSFRFPDHSAAPDGKGQGGIIHLYTNKYGTEAAVGVYAPHLTADSPKIVPFLQYEYDKEKKRYTDEVINIGVRVEYSNGLHISFSHVSGATDTKPNDDGSFRIGNIAGPGMGGEGDGYNHSHIQFTQNVYKRGKVIGRRRVDPRSIFCKQFGF